MKLKCLSRQMVNINQHLTAAVHIVGHVLDDGSSNFEVRAVDAVVNRVLLKN